MGHVEGEIERRSEAEAESAELHVLDFAHKEGEIANTTIERFDVAVKYYTDQRVVMDDNHLKRMLLARPVERYTFVKQSSLLAPKAARPDLTMLKMQLRDIESEFQKRSTRGKAASESNEVKVCLEAIGKSRGWSRWWTGWWSRWSGRPRRWGW